MLLIYYLAPRIAAAAPFTTSERGRGGSRSVFISAARRLDRRRVYDEAANVIETHEHPGDFKEGWRVFF